MTTPPPLKEALVAQGLWAKKSLGQHFLLDLGVTRRIAAIAGDLKGQAVIEIGPGPGGLTRALIEAGADPLIVIEKDTRFAAFLQELVPWSDNRLRIVEADAMAVDESALLAQAGVTSPARIVANLPYNVGTPLLVKWLKAGAWRGAMTLMFQKEVAQRVAAQPGSSAYGRLAVLAQSVCRARLALTLPAGAFTPPPKVASAVVQLDPLRAPFADLDGLERVTAAAFGQRRKMLRSALAGLGDSEALCAAAGVLPTARAEELSVAQFQALTMALSAR
jgi:16S rRNA (adenine1518-N6/adenine1519-N6)-dimethyltransferase